MVPCAFWKFNVPVWSLFFALSQRNWNPIQKTSADFGTSDNAWKKQAKIAKKRTAKCAEIVSSWTIMMKRSLIGWQTKKYYFSLTHWTLKLGWTRDVPFALNAWNNRSEADVFRWGLNEELDKPIEGIQAWNLVTTSLSKLGNWIHAQRGSREEPLEERDWLSRGAENTPSLLMQFFP